MEFKKLTAKDKTKFDRDGYLIAISYFSRKETDRVYQAFGNDQVLHNNTYGRKDKDGNTTKLALWYNLGTDIYSLFVRSQRMVQAVRLLLGGEPAHYHTKLMQKEPRVGGAWEWHQDYGYWYYDGFMYPDMLSVMIALTAATKENGCLQVIRGSHKLGRIDHGRSGDQKGAEMERVDQALQHLPLDYVELGPGDTLFFHSNLLHRSDMNQSDEARCSMITAFNRISNKPFKKLNPSCQAAMDPVPDAQLVHAALAGLSANSEFNK